MGITSTTSLGEQSDWEANASEQQKLSPSSLISKYTAPSQNNNLQPKKTSSHHHQNNNNYYQNPTQSFSSQPQRPRAQSFYYYSSNSLQTSKSSSRRKFSTLDLGPLVQNHILSKSNMAGKTKPTKRHSNNRKRHSSTGSCGSEGQSSATDSTNEMASNNSSPTPDQGVADELIQFKEAPKKIEPLGNGIGIPGLNFVSGKLNDMLNTVEKIPSTILSPVHGLLNHAQTNGEVENDEKAGDAGKVSNGGIIQEVLQIPGNLVNGIVSGNDEDAGKEDQEEPQSGTLLTMTLFPLFGILTNVVNFGSVQEMFAKEGVHMFVTIAKETGLVLKQQLIVLWQMLAAFAYNHPILLSLCALMGSTVVCPILVVLTLVFLPFGIAGATILAPIWLALCAGGIITLTALSPVLIFSAMIVFIFRRFRTMWT